MEEELTADLTEWVYPELDFQSGQDDADEGALFVPDVNEYLQSDSDVNDESRINGNSLITSDDNQIYAGNQPPRHEEQKQLSVDKKEEEELLNKARERLAEIENIKLDYQARIDSLNQLMNKIKTPLSLIDQDVIELMQDIVKKIAKRIICKEISTDPQIFTQVITELKTLIDANNNMINIFLSKTDFEKWTTEQTQSLGIAHSDDSLEQGDVIIKSNFAEIRALLNDRIDQLMRIQHD